MSTSLPTRLRIPGTWNLGRVTCEPVAVPPDGHSEDARLMLKGQAGDDKALAGLIDRYSGFLERNAAIVPELFAAALQN